jgi:hypothetical protein
MFLEMFCYFLDFVYFQGVLYVLYKVPLKCVRVRELIEFRKSMGVEYTVDYVTYVKILCTSVCDKYGQWIFNLDMYVTHKLEYNFTLCTSKNNMFHFVSKYSQSGLLV